MTGTAAGGHTAAVCGLFWAGLAGVKPGERAVTVPGAMPSTSAVPAVSRSRNNRSAMTCRCRSGSRRKAAMMSRSTTLPLVASAGHTVSLNWTSWRRRQVDMPTFNAVRTIHARGAGCLRTFRQEAHVRANASSTRSSAR